MYGGGYGKSDQGWVEGEEELGCGGFDIFRYHSRNRSTMFILFLYSTIYLTDVC